MQGIITKLITLVEEKLKVPCLYNDWNRLNKDTDKLSKSISDKDPKFPAVYIVIPAQGSVDSRFGRYRQSSILTINFLIETLERADFDGVENESRIEAMKYLAIRFLYHFENSRLFEPLADIIDFRNLYMVTDNSLTGVSITIPVKELEGICFDDVEEEEEEKEVEPEADGIDDESYYIFTQDSDAQLNIGYYGIDGEFVENHNYTTYLINISLDRGNVFRFTGFVDTDMLFDLGGDFIVSASVFEPVREINYILSSGTTSIRVTTRADVPFKVKIGTF